MGLNIRITGNPFVDAGAFAALKWVEKNDLNELTIDDLLKVAEDVSSLYANHWKSKLCSIYPNNSITNPANSKKDQQKLAFEKFNIFLKSYKNKTAIKCSSCGFYPAEHNMTKMDLPLSGSGALTNFHPLKSEGIKYCGLCGFFSQISALLCLKCGGRLALIQSNSKLVYLNWAKKCILEVKSNEVKSNFDSKSDKTFYSNGYTNPKNALFKCAEELLKMEKRYKHVSLRLYYFTNFQQSPELDIYDLPTSVFNFLAAMFYHDFEKEWQRFIIKGYKYIAFDDKGNVCLKKGNKLIEVQEDDYKNKNNRIYEKLLAEKSITNEFYYKRENLVSWKIVEIYQKEVRNMSDERLNAIKAFADQVSEMIQTHGLNKRLFEIEKNRTFGEMRSVLIRLLKDRVKYKYQEPLITYDDYCNLLFPEPQYWQETKDLILFRLYEKLHNWLIEQKVTEDNEEIENNKEKEGQND